ncbi:hypothetical protein PoB_006096400 [Plakobranchus ocellatus]|uniref:Secreted protein n=1 Tax=Plakobranchus ocellatus TaxID=259542 RepID=A0AAV4CRD8_9GAST|nr:hypothetical protein PoB_006096400 [Plakobranchus ocellatus]
MGMLLYFSRLIVAALFSEVNAGAWSLVCCMARWRNFRIIFNTVVIATRFCRQRITLRDLLANPVGRASAISRHSDKTCKMVSSCSPQASYQISITQSRLVDGV